MTQDEIIEMANEAGIIQPQNVIKTLEAFAKLVAQHEREACANLCEDIGSKDDTFYREESSSSHCADAIRARGQA
jgi:hypothetical protein